MKNPRFVLIPGENKFNRDQQLGSSAFMSRSSAALRSANPQPIPLSEAPDQVGKVVDVLASIDTGDGVDALLVDLSETDRLNLQMLYPDLRVVAEGQAEMAFVRAILQPPPLATMSGTALALAKIKVQVRNANGKAVSKATVELITDATTSPMTGSGGVTNAKGEVDFPMPKNQRHPALLRVNPAHSYWPAALTSIKWTGSKTFNVICEPIDLSLVDSLRHFGGAGQPEDGKGVVVAVIDGGAGPHEGLPNFTGKNFTDPRRPTDDISDNGVGHGTHVAGIIAGQEGQRSEAGMAPGCTLRVYRVYAKNSMSTGGFSVAAALQAAVDDGADIINLSLTLPVQDLTVVRQLQRARAKGTVCVAAAGNSGGPVEMPASHDAVIGVSALGCKGCWPTGACHELDIRPAPKGKNPKHFTANFSCFGSEIDLSGPGVGIVSLYPKNRLAVLNGTSMAAPAVAGLIARRLAKEPDILRMPRDQARSDKIVALALSVAKTLGFPAKHQGRGILT